MAVICPHCKTKNRSIAKFCIECIGSLPTAYADDLPDAKPGATKLAYAAPRAEAIAAAPVTLSPDLGVDTSATSFPKGLWISVAAFSVALGIGAAGWLVAGAGGWYLYAAGKAQVDPPPQVIATPASVVAPTPASPPASAASPPEVPPGIAQELARREIEEVPAAPPPAVSKSLPRHARSKEPAAACADLNFVSAARCMAAQCLKPEFSASAKCAAVRRNQALEEARRNPVAP